MRTITFLLTLIAGASLASATPLQGASAAPAPSAAQSTPSTPADSTPRSPGEYVLGSQDVLKITVFQEPGLTGSYRIDADGAFDYMFLGRVMARGKTPRELQAEITTRLADGWVRRPQVTVDLEQYRPRSFYVIGEVRSPNRYPLTGQMSLIEALAQAGYMTSTAGGEVLVLHPAPDGATNTQLNPDLTDEARITRVSIADLQSGRLAMNVLVSDGDTVFVPKAQTFFIGGQVKNPSRFTWERGMTVRQALILAGGLTEKGSNRRLKVVRTVNGKQVREDIELDDEIRPNDQIEVPQRLL